MVYREQRNSDGDGIQYQQKIEVSGATISNEVILPAHGSHSFSFSTTGSGTIQVSLSTERDIINSAGVWVDNDLTDGPSLSASKIGFFKGCTGIRINNASGDSVLELITKGA